ncbi:MAG TPA: hypothetical protein DCS43_16405 [Verrucomicrobia bacterium]|nr:hypothetical protein [Verrucomicrobiota bacterium]
MATSQILLKNRFYEISFDVKTGRWSAKDRMAELWAFRDAQFRVDKSPGQNWREPGTVITCKKQCCQSVFGKGTELEVTFAPTEGYDPIRILQIRLYNKLPFIEIGWGIKNRFAYPIRIAKVDVVYGGELFCGQPMTDANVLRSGAGAEPNLVEKGWQIAADNGAMLTYLNQGVRKTMVAGGLAYGDFGRIVEWRDGERGAGKRVRNEGFRNMNLSFTDPQGRMVAPGEIYLSPDTAYLDFVTSDPFDALEAYGQALRVANNANPNVYDFPTLCGWMVSTKHLGEGKPINNSAGLIEQTRLARERGLMKYTPLAVRLEPDTYCYNNFGDTQQGWWDDEHWAAYGPGDGHAKGNGDGSLQKPYETFAKFCKALNALGGIPFTYFQSSMPSNDFAVANPDWMLNKDISRLHYTHAHHRPFVRYDYTHPTFRAHCLAVWQRLRKAGLKGIKFDYPETAWAKDGGFADTRFTTTAAYREMFRLCREGLGKDAFIHERNLGGATHEDAPRLDSTAGIVDIQRVWGDASHFEPEMASRMGLRWYKARSVFLYYPDGKSFTMEGKPIDAYKRRTFLTIMGFISGRLEIGTSIGSMTDEMFYDVTRLFPMLGGTQSPRPVDMLTGGAHPSVYAYKVTESWMQVMLINNQETASSIVAPLSGDQASTGSLGLEPDACYHAFEFWTQAYLGVLAGTGKLSVKLRGGESAMVSLRKVEAQPQVISTNRHIMQGMMECHELKWSGTRNMFSGKVDVVGGEAFVLTMADNGKNPLRCDGAVIRKRRGDVGLLDLVFSSDVNAQCRFELAFE